MSVKKTVSTKTSGSSTHDETVACYVGDGAGAVNTVNGIVGASEVGLRSIIERFENESHIQSKSYHSRTYVRWKVRGMSALRRFVRD